MNPSMPANSLPAKVVNELLHASADAAIVSDESGTIRFVNRRAEELFGYPASELVGKSVETLIPHEHRDRHAPSDWQAIEIHSSSPRQGKQP